MVRVHLCPGGGRPEVRAVRTHRVGARGLISGMVVARPRKWQPLCASLKAGWAMLHGVLPNVGPAGSH